MTHAFRSGLVAPAGVAVATLVVWAVAGPVWALAVLGAGALAIIAFHLWNIERVTEWARGPLDALPPEGRGPWAEVCSAIFRRTRLRTAYQHDLKLTIDRFRKAAEAIPDGVIVLDAAGRIEWANPRAEEQLGIDLARDRGQPVVNLIRQPEFHRYLEAGDYGESVLVEWSRAARAARSRCRPSLSRSTSACCCRATSRRSRRSRACGATSSRTFRTSSRRRSR